MTHVSRSLAAPTLAAALALAALPAAAQDGITVVHAQGETSLTVPPANVVTFDYGVLDTLRELGVDVSGTVKGFLPPSFAEYGAEDVADVGTFFEPDFEAVNAVEPGVIFIGARTAPAYGELSAIAPTIDLTLDDGDFLGSFDTATETLGRLFGAEDVVAERLAAIDEQVAAVQAKAADAGTALIILTSGGEVSAFGPGSRFGMIHDVLGVAPAVEDVEAATHGEAISFEFILEADPDILYVIDRDATIGQAADTAQQILDNEIIEQTRAFQNDDIVYLDGVAWYLAPNGLSAVESAIAEIDASID